MTVKELKELLEVYPDDLPVVVKTYSAGHTSFDDVTRRMVFLTTETTKPSIVIEADFN